jgi:hypothetical protein
MNLYAKGDCEENYLMELYAKCATTAPGAPINDTCHTAHVAAQCPATTAASGAQTVTHIATVMPLNLML